MNLLVLDPTENPVADSMIEPARKHLAHHRPACFRKEIDSLGICWLTFDTPDASANVWNISTLDELDCHIEDVHRDSSIKALIIRSSKDRVYIAGADLKAVQVLPQEELRHLLSLGQDVFTHLESLRIPKIAAIHGACVGGGFEMTLACDWRIASSSDATRIGLPETQLGLIPAWGGCTRLSRLIGLPAALDLIIRGKLLNAEQAKKKGLIHQVVHQEQLAEVAQKLALGTSRVKHPHFHASQLWPLPQLLRLQSKSVLLGKAPWMKNGEGAPMVAIDVVTKGAMRTFDHALKLEQEGIRKLVTSFSTKRILATFLRNEGMSKKLPAAYGQTPSRKVTNAAVIGAGVMGSGIAYVMGSKGSIVLVADSSLDALGKGALRVRDLCHKAERSHVLDHKQTRETQDRIAFTHENVPLQRMDLIVEAVIEDMEVKKALLHDLAARCSEKTILATNTSALSVTEMARGVPHPERVIGLHFFNPAHLMPLVEVVRHAGTTPEVIATALRYVQSLGKTPILVQDRPGFVVNRILMPYLLGAVQIAETMRDPWDLDDAMTEFGMPMGPLRLLDEVGFDVALHVEKTLRSAFGSRIPQTSLLQRMVEQGMMGHKNAAGFYTDHDGKYGAQPNPKVLALLRPKEYPLFKTKEAMAEHLHSLMQAEARLCLDERVAATAHEIEMAMVLGAGYPPFKELFKPASERMPHFNL